MKTGIIEAGPIGSTIARRPARRDMNYRSQIRAAP